MGRRGDPATIWSMAPASLPPTVSPPAEAIDQRVALHGVSWEEFERFLEMRGDDAGLRIAHLEGELELISPSHHHESSKKCLARLLEAGPPEPGSCRRSTSSSSSAAMTQRSQSSAVAELRRSLRRTT